MSWLQKKVDQYKNDTEYIAEGLRLELAELRIEKEELQREIVRLQKVVKTMEESLPDHIERAEYELRTENERLENKIKNAIELLNTALFFDYPFNLGDVQTYIQKALKALEGK